jgi:hypothetical protein
MPAIETVGGAWSLRPRLGLGDIRFQMTRQAVNGFADRIGGIRAERPGGDASEGLEEHLAPFAQFFSSGDVAASRQALQELAPAQRGMMTEHRDSGLILDYRDGALSEIIVPQSCGKLAIGGVPLFGVPPLAAIAAVRRATGEAPLINRSFVLFPESLITLYDFVRQDGHGGIEVADAASEDFDEMSISWRGTPPGPDEDWSAFEPLVLS